MFRKLHVLPLVFVAACANQTPDASIPDVPAVPPTAEDTCGANGMAHFIGRPSTSLETTLLLQPVRIIRPGDAVTEDFLPTRINFMLDANDIIRNITCG